MAEFIIGLIVGTVVTFIGYVLIETFKDHVFKNNIKKLVKIELNDYLNFLNEILKRGIDDTKTIRFEKGHEMIRTIKQMMPNSGKFNPVNYRNLKGETKAKVFDSDTLVKLEETYRIIEYLQVNEGREDVEFGYFFFGKAEIQKIIGSIQKIIDKL